MHTTYPSRSTSVLAAPTPALEMAKVYNPRLPTSNNHATHCGNKAAMLFLKALHLLLERL